MIADSAVQSGHRKVYYVDENENILKTIRQLVREGDILLTMGAGPINKYGESFLNDVEN